MTTQTRKQLSTQQTNNDEDADNVALAAAARGILAGDFIGIPLKFAKGRWSKHPNKDERIEVGDTQPFIVDLKSYANGWVRWENKKPTVKHIYRPINGWILPVRDRLPDQDKSCWPLDNNGKRADPWQENHQIVLKDLSDNSLVTWTTTSWYGHKAIGRLLDVCVRQTKQHPGLMPVVLLGTYDEKSIDYGLIPAPTLKITD